VIPPRMFGQAPGRGSAYRSAILGQSCSHTWLPLDRARRCFANDLAHAWQTRPVKQLRRCAVLKGGDTCPAPFSSSNTLVVSNSAPSPNLLQNTPERRLRGKAHSSIRIQEKSRPVSRVACAAMAEVSANRSKGWRKAAVSSIHDEEAEGREGEDWSIAKDYTRFTAA
jgi:hypothetical protein